MAQAPGVLFERVGDDAVLLDPASGRYTRLNSTGRVLWERLSTPATGAALADHLARAYGLDPAAARRDTGAFVDTLRERGLLAEG